MSESGPPQDPQQQRPPQQGEQPEKRPRIGLILLLVFIGIVLAAQLLRDAGYREATISEVEWMVENGHAQEVEFATDRVKVTLKETAAAAVAKRRLEQIGSISGSDAVREQIEKEISEGKSPQHYKALSSSEQHRAKLLEKWAKRLDLRVREAPRNDFLGGMLIFWMLPILLIVFVFWFLMRRMGPPQGVMNFGKSKAKIYAEKEVHVSFDDVAGVDEAVEEVREIVEFLKEPKKFQALGARIPKGVLLLGAPGTGKTLLARAVAGEAGVPFFSLSGSDFVEMFVGVGASRVRDLFQQAEQQAPCLVFIDELDALGKTRGTSPISNDEREQTLNALLVEMDGFDANNGVIIIAATNRPEILDPALMRAGRFDRQIVVDRPDVIGRKAILSVHARKVKLHDGVDLEVLARRTPGFSGADLANLINEGALLAARRDKKTVEMSELEEAIDRVMTGLERRRRVMNEKEKEITAAHETGHAIVAFHSPGADPVHRISIIPRGVGIGGHTLFLAEEERSLYSRKDLVARIQAMLGGRAAEKVVYGHLSTGASNDLEVASRLARHMITRYGMSERVGPVSLESEGSQFLRDGSPGPGRNYSDDTQHIVDAEVRTLIERAEERAIEILETYRHKLDEIRDLLMEREVIERKEFERLMSDAPSEPAAVSS